MVHARGVPRRVRQRKDADGEQHQRHGDEHNVQRLGADGAALEHKHEHQSEQQRHGGDGAQRVDDGAQARRAAVAQDGHARGGRHRERRHDKHGDGERDGVPRHGHARHAQQQAHGGHVQRQQEQVVHGHLRAVCVCGVCVCAWT